MSNLDPDVFDEDGNIVLTDDEKKAIKSLKRLAKRWPKTLMLYSANGWLTVIRCAEDGTTPLTGSSGSGVDENAVVDVIHGIRNDGGDW